jgi:hypothetical protein
MLVVNVVMIMVNVVMYVMWWWSSNECGDESNIVWGWRKGKGKKLFENDLKYMLTLSWWEN